MHPAADVATSASTHRRNDDSSIDIRGKSLGAQIVANTMDKYPQADLWQVKNEKVGLAITES
jgi:hypothetical protein